MSQTPQLSCQMREGGQQLASRETRRQRCHQRIQFNQNGLRPVEPHQVDDDGEEGQCQHGAVDLLVLFEGEGGDQSVEGREDAEELGLRVRFGVVLLQLAVQFLGQEGQDEFVVAGAVAVGRTGILVGLDQIERQLVFPHVEVEPALAGEPRLVFGRAEQVEPHVGVSHCPLAARPHLLVVEDVLHRVQTLLRGLPLRLSGRRTRNQVVGEVEHEVGDCELGVGVDGGGEETLEALEGGVGGREEAEEGGVGEGDVLGALPLVGGVQQLEYFLLLLHDHL